MLHVVFSVGNHDDTSDIPVFDEDTIMPVDASETMLSPGGTSVSNLRRMSHSRQGMRTLWSEMPEVRDHNVRVNNDKGHHVRVHLSKVRGYNVRGHHVRGHHI